MSVRAINQAGGILIMGAFLLATIFTFGLLVIDIARFERCAETLQRAADAAALAGAELLKRSEGPITNGSPPPGIDDDEAANERPTEWRAAKKAALRLLKQEENPIFGAISQRITTQAATSDCGRDLDTDPELACRTFTYPDAVVTIERGYNFRREDQPTSAPVYGDPLFVSLEGQYETDLDGNLAPDITDLNDLPAACRSIVSGGVHPTRLANAVRVRLTLRKLPLTMGALVSLITGPSITREAIASVDLPATRGISVPTSGAPCP